MLIYNRAHPTPVTWGCETRSARSMRLYPGTCFRHACKHPAGVGRFVRAAIRVSLGRAMLAMYLELTQRVRLADLFLLASLEDDSVTRLRGGTSSCVCPSMCPSKARAALHTQHSLGPCTKLSTTLSSASNCPFELCRHRYDTQQIQWHLSTSATASLTASSSSKHMHPVGHCHGTHG